MLVRQIPVKIAHLEVFSYLVACDQTKQGIIIDPAAEIDKIVSHIKDTKVDFKYIICTHGHPDHVAGAKELKEITKAKIVLHKEDMSFFHSETAEEVFKKLGLFYLPEADILVKDGDILQVGSLNIHILHTPGHTPGSICLYVDSHLFTGDTLFVGAVGRTDLAGSSFEQLLNSIKEKILPIPDETIIWPAHAYEDVTSTVGKEKETNPYIVEFILNE